MLDKENLKNFEMKQKTFLNVFFFRAILKDKPVRHSTTSPFYLIYI